MFELILVSFIPGFRQALAKAGMTLRDLRQMRKQWIANGRPRPDKAGPVQASQRIREIGNFAQAVARLQAAQSVNARLRLVFLTEQYQSSLQHLEARGALTLAVAAEFRGLAGEAGRSIIGLAAVPA